MIVIDASATIEFLLDTPRGRRIGDRIEARSASIHVPHLMDAEVLDALRRLVRRKGITAARGTEALNDLMNIVAVRYPHDVLLPRMWELRGTAGAYDAAYLSLAEILQAPLITCDRRLSGIPGHRATIELI